MSIKNTELWRVVDPATGDYIESFLLRGIRVFYLRSASTGRFIQRLQSFYICNTCTFESDSQKDYTKTLYIESTECYALILDQLADIRGVEELEFELDSISQQESCTSCCDKFEVMCEVVGTTFTTIPYQEKCEYGRIKAGKKVKSGDLYIE